MHVEEFMVNENRVNWAMEILPFSTKKDLPFLESLNKIFLRDFNLRNRLHHQILWDPSHTPL